MNSTLKLFLKDKVLAAKAAFFSVTGRTLAQRSTLDQLLEIRRQRFAADNAAFVDIYEGLAYTYFDFAADDLIRADELAQEAQRILLLTSKQGKHTFRAGKLLHMRCQIQQRLNHREEALQLGEEALAVYNDTNKLLSYERAALMHTLVNLHGAVGSLERAEQLAIEAKVLDQVLMSIPARRRC